MLSNSNSHPCLGSRLVAHVLTVVSLELGNKGRINSKEACPVHLYICHGRSDSMLIQKVLLPLPACDRFSDLQCDFHLLFDALRQQSCRLTQLNLNVLDAMCLGNHSYFD